MSSYCYAFKLAYSWIFRISVMFEDNNGRTWQSGTKSNIAM